MNGLEDIMYLYAAQHIREHAGADALMERRISPRSLPHHTLNLMRPLCDPRNASSMFWLSVLSSDEARDGLLWMYTPLALAAMLDQPLLVKALAGKAPT